MTPRDTIWRRLLAWPTSKPVFTIIVTLLCIAAAIAGVLRLRADTSLQAMFAKDDPAARTAAHVLDEFRAAEDLLILVTILSDQISPDASQNAARLLSFAEQFELAALQSAQAEELTSGITYRADTDSRRFVEKVLVPAGLLYLDDVSFEALMKRLS